MLAYDPDQPTNYDARLTIASLLIAVAATTAGLRLPRAAPGWTVAAGGAIIGAGIGLMHFTGMRALSCPAHRLGPRPGCSPPSSLASSLAAAAMMVCHELKHRKRALDRTGPADARDLRIAFHRHGRRDDRAGPRHRCSASAIESSTLAIAVTAITVLAMLAVLAMMLITSEGKRDALRRNQELVDASLEGLVVAQGRDRIVNVNRRFIELTGKSPKS